MKCWLTKNLFILQDWRHYSFSRAGTAGWLALERSHESRKLTWGFPLLQLSRQW
jgi:hypothetical protein